MHTSPLLGALALAATLATAAGAPCVLSKVFGPHAVLQRGKSASVFGTADAGVVVTTLFNGDKLSTTAAGGVWRQALPPQPAGGPFTLNFTCSSGEAFSIADVLFGDVFLTSGVSTTSSTTSSA